MAANVKCGAEANINPCSPANPSPGSRSRRPAASVECLGHATALLDPLDPLAFDPRVLARTKQRHRDP